MATTNDAYMSIDINQTSGRAGDMLSTLGANGVNDAALFPAALGDMLKQQADTSNAVSNVVNMNNSAQRDSQFQHNTNLLAQMNESYNANRYILNTLNKEDLRLSTLDSRARRDIYRLKQEDLHAVYAAQLYRFMRNLAIATLVVLLLLLLCVALYQSDKLSFRTAVAIGSTIILVYLIVIIANRVSIRRTTDWSSYFFYLS